ncbi:MAG: hypothetical protein JJ971_00970 [Balneolaceae bacterium]|nr:hypothetical protein [Balneolaceae bacterium]MBO6544942.1 hypothetical protein [Balneolaceae bacterium]MBO6646338.1 hypothetical protein [Balneolaceae bacterium]
MISFIKKQIVTIFGGTKSKEASSLSELVILIDYDNIKSIFRQRGLVHVVDRIMLNISPSISKVYNRYRLRLYGGWYESNNLSRNAQMLSAEISSNYPDVRKIKKNDKESSSIINVELAFSLESDHKHKLFNTYRKNRTPHGIRSAKRPFNQCSNPKSCTLDCIPSFLNKKKCPDHTCQASLNDILIKNEQKLVDTMLTSDIIFLSFRDNDEVCVVTSDDDIWPGINTALFNNTQLIHLHTHSNRKTPAYYIPHGVQNYTQINMT